jgi:hypothetical protein
MSKTVYIIQELPGTKIGAPKYNIMGASKFGDLKTLLPENSQIIMSPGPLICSIVSDITNGKFNFLKWDRQEKMYYPIKVNLYEKGEIED